MYKPIIERYIYETEYDSRPIMQIEFKHQSSIDYHANNHIFCIYRENHESIVIPPRMNYMCGLRNTQRVYELESGHCLIADCDKHGNLKRNCIILEKKTFCCKDTGMQATLFLCRCAAGCDQRDRLKPLCTDLTSDFYDFYYRETDNRCIHSEAAAAFFDEDVSRCDDSVTTHGDTRDPSLFPIIQQLSEDPLLVVVETSSGVDVLQHTSIRTKTMLCTCAQGKRQCQHKKAYNQWTIDQGLLQDATIENDSTDDDQPSAILRRSMFRCVSKKKIKTPLSPEQQALYR